jgi:hypothetical protein
MKLVETRETAEACVILSSGFANVGNWVFFADETDAKKFADENDGRVVDRDGLAEKFESMHCAAGRTPNQSSSGRFLEGDEDTDWDQVWDEEYAEDAKDAFENATVHKIEDDEEVDGEDAE